MSVKKDWGKVFQTKKSEPVMHMHNATYFDNVCVCVCVRVCMAISRTDYADISAVRHDRGSVDRR